MRENNRFWNIAVYAILFIIIVIFSSKALWVHDDLNQAFYCGDEMRQIKNIGDIFVSQWGHYVGANGRYVAHWIVQFILVYLPKIVFALLNGIVYVCFVRLILKLSKTEGLQNTILIAALAIVAFQTKFTPTCQVGYVWMFTLTMFAAWLFVNKDANTAVLPFWAIVGFLAGWGQECLFIGVAPALALYGICNIRHHTLTQWVLAVSYAIGGCLLVFSPANFQRAATDDVSLLESLFNMGMYLKAFFLMILMVGYCIFNKKATLKYVVKSNLYLFVALAFLLAFNLFIGIFSNRQMFGIELISVFILLQLMQQYDINLSVKRLLCGVTMIYAIAICIYDQKYLTDTNKVYDNLMSQYQKSKDGKVYYDFKTSDILGDGNIPSEGFDEKVIESLNRRFRSEGEKKQLVTYPTFLKDKLDANLPTQAVRINDDAWLLICSNEDINKTSFLIKRRFNICIYNRNISDREIYANTSLFNITEEHFSAAIIYRGNAFIDNYDTKIK